MCAQSISDYIAPQINTLNRRSKSRAAIDSVIGIIQAEYADPSLAFQTVADSPGVSTIHLNRPFKALQGCSLDDYLNRVRVQNTCVLLREESTGIEAIDRKTGFLNSKYFYVLFKSVTGHTPRQYRMQQTA